LPASADLVSLASEITAVMHSGGRQTVALGGSGGALVLNGAELSFAVLCPVPKAPPVVPTGPVVTSSMPHDTQVGGPGRTTPAS
jgi:hypothetical protein